MAEWRERGYVPDSDDEDEDEVPALPFEPKLAAPPPLPDQADPKVDSKSLLSINTGNDPNDNFKEVAIDAGSSSAEKFATSISPAKSTAESLQENLEIGLRTIQEVLNRPRTPLRNENPINSTDSSPLSSIGSIEGFSSPVEPSCSPIVPPVEDASTSLEADLIAITAATRIGRALRERNPIQLHPYALEQALYQQTWTSRGLQPIRALVGPPDQPKASEKTGDSQELSISESSPAKSLSQPAESEDISQSPIRGGRVSLTQWNLDNNDNNHDDDDLPDLATILRGDLLEKSKIYRRDRNLSFNPLKTFNGAAPLRHKSVPFLVDSAMDAMFDIPPSPPRSVSASSVFDLTGPSPPTFRAATPPALPTPVLSSNNRPKRQAIEISSSSDSSQGSDQGSEAGFPDDLPIVEPRKEDLRKIKRRMKGVLPASWLKLDLKKQVASTQRPVSSHSPVKASEGRGIALRVTSKATGAAKRRYLPKAFLSDEYSDGDVSMETVEKYLRSPGNYQGEDSDIPDAFMGDAFEEDRVDAMPPRASRNEPKRIHRKQTRIDDQWVGMRDVDSSTSTRKAPRSKASQHPKPVTQRRPKPPRKRQRQQPSLPQLSILDAPGFVQLPPSQRPRFLRLAGRTAHTETGPRHQDVNHKYFRLEFKQDTAELNGDLDIWRSGVSRAAEAQTLHQRANANLPLSVGSHKRNAREVGSLKYLKESTNSTLQHILAGKQQPSGSISTGTEPQPLPHRTSSQLQALFPPRHSHQNRSGIGNLLRPPTGPRVAQLESAHTRRATRTVLKAQSALIKPINMSGIISSAGDAPFPTHPPRRPALPVVPQKTLAPPPSSTTARKRNNPVFRKAQRDRTEDLDDLSDHNLSVATRISQTVDHAPNGGIRPTAAVDFERATTSFSEMEPLPQGTKFDRSTFVGQGFLARTRRLMNDTTRDMSAESISVENLQTGRTYTWCGPSLDFHLQYEIVLGGVQSQLETIIFSPLGIEGSTHLVPGSPLRNLHTKCMSCIDSIISYVNDGIPLVAEEKARFVLKSLDCLRKIYDRFKTLTPIPGGPAHWCLQHSLNRLVVMAYQTAILAMDSVAVEWLADGRASEPEDFLSASMALCLSTELELNRLEHLRQLSKMTFNSGGTIRINEHLPGVEAIIIVKTLCAGRWGEKWPTKFNGILSEAALSANISATTRVVTLMSVFSAISPIMEMNANGTLEQKLFPEPTYNGWSILVPAISGLLKEFTSTKDVKIRANRCFGLHMFKFLYSMTKDWGWGASDSLAQALVWCYNSNDMRTLFNVPARPEPTFPAFLLRYETHVTHELEEVDSDFDICLKLISFALRHESLAGDFDKRTESNMRSFVFSLIPNVGEVLRGVETLRKRDLQDLINRASLFTVLYCCAPKLCRPRLSQIEGLAVLTNSHAVVWEVMIETWSILTRYHIMSACDDEGLLGLSSWIQSMISQMIVTYKGAREEAMQVVRAAGRDQDAGALAEAEGVIKSNQSRVSSFIGTCFSAWTTALAYATSATQEQNLLYGDQQSNFLQMCFKSSMFGDALAVRTLLFLSVYLTKVARSALLSIVIKRPESLKAILIERLESPSEDDYLLKTLTNCWFVAASELVKARLKCWDDFLDAHGSLSWEQLSYTLCSTQCKAYFFAQMMRDPDCYVEHRDEILRYWIGRLVLPASSLRFENHLTEWILKSGIDELQTCVLEAPMTERPDSLQMADFIECRIAIIQKLFAKMSQSGQSVHQTSGFFPGGIRAVVQIMTKSMKAGWRSLAPDQAKQAEYARLIYDILDSVELAVVNPQVDAWFTNNQEFPQRPIRVGDLLRLVPSVPKTVNQSMVDQFRVEVIRAALEGRLVNLADDLGEVFGWWDHSTINDNVLQISFAQSLTTAYVESALTAPGHLLALPIIYVLKHWVALGIRRSESHLLVRFGKAIFHLLVAVRKAFQTLNPVSLTTGANEHLFRTYVLLFQFAAFAFQRFLWIAEVVENKHLHSVIGSVSNNIRYIYSHVWCATQGLGLGNTYNPVNVGVLSSFWHGPLPTADAIYTTFPTDFGLSFNEAILPKAEKEMKDYAGRTLGSCLRDEWRGSVVGGIPTWHLGARALNGSGVFGGPASPVDLVAEAREVLNYVSAALDVVDSRIRPR